MKHMRQAAMSWTDYHFALAKTSSRLLPLSRRGEKKKLVPEESKRLASSSLSGHQQLNEGSAMRSATPFWWRVTQKLDIDIRLCSVDVQNLSGRALSAPESL